MFTRATLKAQAKEAMRRNYWKSVLTGLLLAERLGGYKKMNEELSKRSEYYNQEFMQMDRVKLVGETQRPECTSSAN